MACSPEQLDEISDKILRSGNFDEFNTILIPNYYHKIGRVDTKSVDEYIQFIKDFNNNFTIINSETVKVDSKDFTGKILCIGTWKWTVGIDDNTNKTITWKGNWSDIRVKCPDGLWRFVGTIGTVDDVY